MRYRGRFSVVERSLANFVNFFGDSSHAVPSVSATPGAPTPSWAPCAWLVVQPTSFRPKSETTLSGIRRASTVSRESSLYDCNSKKRVFNKYHMNGTFCCTALPSKYRSIHPTRPPASTLSIVKKTRMCGVRSTVKTCDSNTSISSLTYRYNV